MRWCQKGRPFTFPNPCYFTTNLAACTSMAFVYIGEETLANQVIAEPFTVFLCIYFRLPLFLYSPLPFIGVYSICKRNFQRRR